MTQITLNGRLGKKSKKLCGGCGKRTMRKLHCNAGITRLCVSCGKVEPLAYSVGYTAPVTIGVSK